MKGWVFVATREKASRSSISLPHPAGRGHHPVEIILSFLAQLAAELRLQAVAEGLDLAERLLQVVRSDGGELLQLAVGALQFVGELLGLLFGPRADVDLAPQGGVDVAEGGGPLADPLFQRFLSF